ncbi:PBSX family phage terminase large subunit [Fictibacillus phosphorivorans]
MANNKQINIEFDESVINDCYLDLLDNESRYLILYGGAGSGKSVFAAQKLVLRMLEESDHKILIVRKVAKTLRESTFSLIRGVISDWGLTDLFDVNKTDMTITCNSNGNQIIHAGLDDVEKMKSIHGITGIWIEEASEVEQQDFQQLDLRLRGFTTNYKQVIISFNPISSLHWLKSVFFNKQRKGATIRHTTYLDNKFIDEDYTQVLESMKEDDPYYYSVYALGQWGVIGQTIFNAQKVNERIDQLRNRPPMKKGQFVYTFSNHKIIDSSIKWVDDENGYISIYKQPEERTPYVIGGDTSGDGSDKFVGQVINNVTGEQVAVLHHQFDEDLYARQVYCLGKYYNEALLAIEVNFSTYPIKELQRLGYRKQYRREVLDNITNKRQYKYGFRTDRTSRPLILADLVQLVRENIKLINDVSTLNEMLTFVRNEKGKAEASQGKHDDLIMGLAIGYKARDQQRKELFELPYTPDPDNPTPEEKHNETIKYMTGGTPPSALFKGWG